MTKYEVLKHYFGYEEFRPLQEKIIDSILSKRDTIALLATGGGKSLTYQIPALLFSGITLIVTPLISLMLDQVFALKKKNIQAAYLNSTLDYFTEEEIYKQLESSKIKLLYLSPEKLQNKRFLKIITKLSISFVCLDESHSIESRYGFRPAYGEINIFINKLSIRPVLAAVTATATKKTIQNIIEVCGMINPQIFTSSFDRPNLFYQVLSISSKYDYLKKYLSLHHTKGIIYCLTRKQTEELYLHLQNDGFSVTYYHGGLQTTIKKENQENYTKNNKRVMIATNSFGLGIDLPNIRFIILYELPSSMEDMVQMIGRCSRDGAYGEGIVLYSPQDITTSLYFINQLKDEKLTRKALYLEKKIRKYQLQMVINFCYTGECLHQYVLRYFNEKGKKCDSMCSICKK